LLFTKQGNVSELHILDPGFRATPFFPNRAERLHADLFYFLGDASKAYNEHFSHELQKVAREARHGPIFVLTFFHSLFIDYSNRCGLALGPAVVIFHETLHTDVLRESADNGAGGVSVSPETAVQNRLAALSQDASAFSKIK